MPRPKKADRKDYIDRKKWNELLPRENGQCILHDFVYWYGTSNLAPNVIGAANCPECEFNKFGDYSEMTKELYKDVRNAERNDKAEESTD